MSARARPGPAGAGGGGPEDRWLVDLHTHTSASYDCLTSPADLVRRARGIGLTKVAITDHDEIDGALEARELAPDLVIVGEEVRTAAGADLIGLFLEERIPPGGTFAEVAAAVREQGGVVYLPHPFDRHRGVEPATLEREAESVDVVEGFNARVHDPGRNREARAWAGERGLPVGAGSDAHTLRELGRGGVRVDPFRGAEAFLEVVRDGEIWGERSGRWVHLASTWAKVRKRLPGG